MKTFNKRLEALIEDCAIRIHGVRTKEEVLALVRSFRKYERRGRVAFDHGSARDVSLLLLCVSVLMWLAYWLWPGTSGEMGAFELFVVLVMNASVVCAPLFWLPVKAGGSRCCRIRLRGNGYGWTAA